MTQMQRVLLVVALVLLSILILFIPFKREVEKTATPKKETTPIAMVSMERLQVSPHKTIETSNTPSQEEMIPASPPVVPVPSEEETVHIPEQTTPLREPLEKQQREEQGGEGYFYTIDMVTTRPQFDRSLLASRIVYPTLAKRQAKEGTVLLRLFIDEKGFIERIIVEEDPGYGFAEAAIEAFTNLQVQPAILNSSPVPVTLLYPIRFTLHNE